MMNQHKIAHTAIWKNIFATILCCCNLMAGSSQTINFINYDEAPAMYNPAMLSSIDRSQVTLNYRNNRFSSDVNTFSSMLSFQLPLQSYFNNLNLGTVSISTVDDRTNYAPSVKTTGIGFAYSQSIVVSNQSFLSLGLQGNFYQKKLDINSFTTGSQWNNDLGFDPSIANGEAQFDNKINRFSINSGIYWQFNRNNKRKMFGGLSVYNLNRPNESFTENVQRQPLRYFMNGGYTLADNVIGNVAVDALGSVQGRQNVGGAGIRTGMYYATNGSGIGEISVYSRFYTNSTLLLGVMLEQKWISIGLSYDFSTSQAYKTVSRSNAFEVFLKARFGRSIKSKNTPIVANTRYQAGQKRVFTEERKTEVIESSTSDTIAFRKVESVSDTTNKNYVPMKLALKHDFRFAFNDAELGSEAKAYLDELAALMKRNNNITLEIIGHTDDVGSKEGNRIISNLRAKVVADYMESNGIERKRLSTSSKMDTEPLFPNTTPENRAKNRRVEFIILN